MKEATRRLSTRPLTKDCPRKIGGSRIEMVVSMLGESNRGVSVSSNPGCRPPEDVWQYADLFSSQTANRSDEPST